MSVKPGEEIRSLFARAALQHEAARGLDGDGWAAYRKITQAHADKLRLEECRFLAEYQTRFEIARQRIIDEGGTRDRNLAPRWVGRDRFDSAIIDRQADREVLAAHEALLKRLDRERDERLNILFTPTDMRREPGGYIKQQFGRAAERRTGPERRRGPPR